MPKDKPKYALFLGCVIPNRYPFIERATRSVFEKLNSGCFYAHSAW